MATITAALLAVVNVAGQYAVFNDSFDGELWGVRYELTPGGGASTVGVAYVNGTAYVTDGNNGGVIVYADNGTIIPMPDADWNQTADESSPAYGLVPNEIAAAVVNVDGTATSAILVSDFEANRVMAFAVADGSHLFTLLLDNPDSTETALLINGMAMGPGARFVLTTAAPSLTLQGSFAAGWTNIFRTNGAVLAYKGQEFSYDTVNAQFSATPAAILVGTEGDDLARRANEPYGVVFDAAGNLYMNDTVTERINVYDANFGHRFTFGTPDADLTTTQFNQPFGMMFWPDAQGGRLFVTDALNNRVEVYRPDFANNTLDYLFTIPLEGDTLPFSAAVDMSTGRIAVADSSQARVWVLQTTDLAAFDLQVLDSGVPVTSICAGDSYQVRFSLTVPAGHAPAADVVPQLFIDGVLESQAPVPLGVYPATPLQPGQVATYTYSLTVPAGTIADLAFEAGATSSSTTDILTRQGGLTVANCTAGAPPTITASPSIAPQAWGWTPVPAGETFTITLTASDDVGVARIEYQFLGANDQGFTIAPIIFPAPLSSPQSTVVPLIEMGDTTIRFRARDSDNRWSEWQELNVTLVPAGADTVPTVNAGNRTSAEGDVLANVAVVTVSHPDPGALTYWATGLPPGLAMNSLTGTVSGTLGYTSAASYPVTVIVRDGSVTGRAWFTWTVINVNRPPVVTNPGNKTSAAGATITVPVIASDLDLETLFYSATGLPQGLSIDSGTGVISGTIAFTAATSNTVTVTVSDGAAVDSESFTWIVTGTNRAPICSAAMTSANLWPPNHQQVYINVSGVVDPEGKPITIRFTSILQDEPTGSVGQGNTMRDGGIEQNGAKAWVRSERSGADKVPGDGRVYLIGFTATDAGALSCTGTVRVDVPHDQRGTPAVLSPGRWNSLTGAMATPPPAPVAVDDTARVATGANQVIAVLSNDVAHGLPLTVTIVSKPGKGSATVNSDGTITFTAPKTTGTTTLTYQTNNGFGGTDTATVSITISNQSHDDADDDDCGDRGHDHRRDDDGRDRDHKRGNHDRCRHRR